jgi:eukaryotic-like serine/threonine-protein kinase
MVSLLRVAVLALALGLVGCGGDDDEGGTTQPTTGPGAAATVPDVAGTQLAEAAQTFADQGLRVAVEYVPSEVRQGSVTGQERAAGTELQRGDTVPVTVSTGPSPAAEVPVPNALDQTAAEGQATLERAGFEVLAIPIPAVTEDTVVFHSPAAGIQIPRGSLVVLYTGS